ncbi:cysteine desulfurase family protein [Shouchella shacheensis]|uniref:cysteine desulfurase family protein n=1 Tax=Shouchella shacheensis TaxID=1649580 RepID=UPI00073FDA48|nr:cysteine desulfurase family protein [Shouchella shacheensis]
MIYLDNSATTRPYKEVLETYNKVSTSYFGNPSSLHTLGVEAERVLTKSRETIAKELECPPQGIIFTSGGTESNSLVIQGMVRGRKAKRRHIVTTTVEHASTYENVRALEKEGVEVTYVEVDGEGSVSVEAIEKAIKPHTVLVTIAHVQSELGTIQPIEEIGHLLKGHPTIKFHVDAVQSIGKVFFSISEAHIDFLTLSSHKIHGLKGTGLLYVRDKRLLTSLLRGGEQEQQLRPGTQNVAGAAAMAKALQLTMKQSREGIKQLEANRSLLINELKRVPSCEINSPSTQGAPHIVNFSVRGMKAEVLVQALAAKSIYVSSQSACSSKTMKPSRILIGAGHTEDGASSAIRISFSFETTNEEVIECARALNTTIPELMEVMT